MDKNGFDFSRNELKGLSYSFIILTIAFSMFFVKTTEDLFFVIPATMLAVALSFTFRQLANKFVANLFGYWAEFQIFWVGLVTAILVAIGGAIFTAPGNVLIYGDGVSKKRNGLICSSGILMNLALSVLFLCLGLLVKYSIIIIDVSLLNNLMLFFKICFISNVSLALFSSFPIGNFDGSGIFKWNPIIWVVFFALILIVFGYGFLFFNTIL